MYAEERQQAIGELIERRGRMSVAELAGRYGVTTETVRRDLAMLERLGHVRRVHGGAIPAASLTVTEPGLAERDQTRAGFKDRIAAAATRFLPESGGSVVIDAGTTTGRLVAALPTDVDLTVVTNSVPIAA
ncbi:DeoR/GlpR family DNA-binding transcription regulator, partial [Rhodococcus sp. CX]|uniref:DeoR/GlpR family DNA-binding transcription regulator n=2 Tax=unclassified Rhodococcus (in: high G+C Gram-positive bacteria) TaxID=192944 RepID=UPI0027DAED2A